MSVFNPTDEIVIRPNQSWLHIDWRGILQYKDLVLLMVRRDFIARYKQTILGPAWFIINPVLTSLTFTLVFSRVLGVGTGGIPPILFYLSGMLGWSYFSTLLSTTSNALLHNASLFGKVYFPRLIVPLAMSISSCIAFAIQLCTFLAVLTFHVVTDRLEVSAGQVIVAIAWLPLIVVHTALLAVGVGLTLASITAKYRDFQHLTGFLLHLWMYASPVIFPFSHVQQKFPGYSWIAALNPMAAVIENIRALFFGSPGMPLPYLGLSIGVAIAMFCFGVLSYQRTARTFIDTV
ncbi:MAG TPA: ABC transporter permease [Opitutus sp.]|nr:ABC transporter permease [Opitutus sp.]